MISRTSPVLPVEKIRAFRLKAHHLDTDLAGSLEAAVAVAGIQDTPPGSGRIGAAIRTRANVEDLDEAINEERRLVVVWSRRGSPHLVPASDVSVFTTGLLPDDEESWRVAIGGFVNHLAEVEMTASEVAAVVRDAVDEALAGVMLTKRELGEAIRPRLPKSMRRWFDADTFSEFSAVTARAASLYGTFLIAPRRAGQASFVSTRDWLEGTPGMPVDLARVELTRRYLHAYGPSTAATFAEWAGLGVSQARRMFEALTDETVEVSTTDGESGVILEEDLRSVESTAEPSSTTLIPAYDPYLAGLDRHVIVPSKEWHPLIWRANHNPGVVSAQGEIVATWRAKQRGRRLDLTIVPLTNISKTELLTLEPQAEHIARHRRLDDASITIGRRQTASPR